MDRFEEGIKNFGSVLKRMRAEKGFTLRELADKVGCSYQLIWSYENGEIGNAPLPRIEKIAEALGTSAYNMLGLGDSKITEDADKVRSAYLNAPENVQFAVRAMLNIK